MSMLPIGKQFFAAALGALVLSGPAPAHAADRPDEEGAFRNYCIDRGAPVAPALSGALAERAALLAELAEIRKSYVDPTAATGSLERFARAEAVKQRISALNERLCAGSSDEAALLTAAARDAARVQLETRLKRLDSRIMSLKALVSDEPERSGDWMEEWDELLRQRTQLEARLDRLAR